MDDIPASSSAQIPLERLLDYLDSDPNNLNLIEAACTAAIDAGLPEKAALLLARHEALAAPTPATRNLAGLVAMQQGRFADAEIILTNLHETRPQDPGLRFNLAWCKSMTGDDEGAATLLDDATCAQIGGAAALKVQALHRLARMETALDCGIRALATRPDDSALKGALSIVALDLRMGEEARRWASGSPTTPEGLSTLGTLALQAHHLDEAMTYFDRGLTVRPDSARNLLGRGLVLMARGDAEGAALALDHSAEVFGDHLGTWVAAGWAHFAAGDRRKARDIFDRTLALDDTFAESHGALAVLDFLDGDVDGARRRAETALRLDRKCFSGALAKTLLLEHDGDPQAARRVRDITLNMPVGEGGETIAQTMVAVATYRGGTRI
jgi:tetratricopeptide (TPR) repeat protein